MAAFYIVMRVEVQDKDGVSKSDQRELARRVASESIKQDGVHRETIDGHLAKSEWKFLLHDPSSLPSRS